MLMILLALFVSSGLCLLDGEETMVLLSPVVSLQTGSKF